MFESLVIDWIGFGWRVFRLQVRRHKSLDSFFRPGDGPSMWTDISDDVKNLLNSAPRRAVIQGPTTAAILRVFSQPLLQFCVYALLLE
eukprot:SAG11_NODE_9353_length_919_cov_1.857317_1_plen_88_part_00